jgi:hypothetical protein
MIVIWWIILVITVLGYGIRMANWNANEATLTSVLAEMLGAGTQFFLLLTSYHYITGG